MFMALITGLAAISFTATAVAMLSAQSIDMGGRGLALGNAAITTATFPFEPVNPAARSASTSIGAVFSFGQAHGLQELRYRSLVLAAPIGPLHAGVTLETFGFDAYRRTTGSLVASVPLISNAWIGARITARNVAFAGYDGRSIVGISAGWVVTVSDHVVIGGAWRHIGSAMAAADRLLPQELMFGFEVVASPEVRLLGAISGESGSDADLRAGVEIDLTGAVAVRAGSGTSPDRISFGFGLTIDPGSLDVGVSLHPILGPSAALSLSLE